MTGLYGFAFAMLVSTGWLYWLTNRAQTILTRAENAEDAADQILDRCDQLTQWLWEAFAPDDDRHRAPEPEKEPETETGPATEPTPAQRSDTAETQALITVPAIVAESENQQTAEEWARAEMAKIVARINADTT